jgi:CBS domain-containing protein
MPQRPIRSIIAHQELLVAPVDMTVREAARQMQGRRVSSLLVVTGDRLVGIFTERDALFRVLAEDRDPKKTRLGDVMTPNPQSIHPDKPLAHALLMMHEGGFRHVPVVEDARPVGMVSARDALALELRELESEIERRKRIGEILG